jgi:hypothetical protein
MTAITSEMRIGVGSRRSVCRILPFSLLPLHSSLAEGNPDEEKIGAFGVGRFKALVEIIDILIQYTNRFLQLVLGNREAVGFFRRYAQISPARCNNHIV